MNIVFSYHQKSFQFDLDTLETWMSVPLKNQIFNLEDSEQLEAAFDLITVKAGLTDKENDELGAMPRYEFRQLFTVGK